MKERWTPSESWHRKEKLKPVQFRAEGRDTERERERENGGMVSCD